MPKKMPPKTAVKICRLYADGLSQIQIGKQVGVHRNAVGRVLNAFVERMPVVKVPHAVECPPHECAGCKAIIKTVPCIACRTREWIANRPKG